MFHRLITSFAHDVSCIELLCKRDAVAVSTQHDDLLGAQALRGDDAAQADSRR